MNIRIRVKFFLNAPNTRIFISLQSAKMHFGRVFQLLWRPMRPVGLWSPGQQCVYVAGEAGVALRLRCLRANPISPAEALCHVTGCPLTLLAPTRACNEGGPTVGQPKETYLPSKRIEDTPLLAGRDHIPALVARARLGPRLGSARFVT